MHNFVSMVDILQQYARDYPHHIAIKFLTPQGYEILTYHELDTKVKTMAGQLQQYGYPDARAVILLPPGLDYIIVFLACLYSGVIAIPVYPPRRNQHAKRVFAIVNDAKASFIITNHQLAAEFPEHQVINVDEPTDTNESSYQPIPIAKQHIAFFQYTSGSTSEPKGVLISHLNIMTNLDVLKKIFPGGEGHKVCSWLPPYHDMGLIGGILCSLYLKTELILMPPAYFLHAPLRWLEIMSKERVTMTVAPNFAFDFCVKKASAELISQLDLSSLQCVYNGSEPIQFDVLQRFNQTYAEAGFSPQAFYSCYGMAEATLMLTVNQFNPLNNSLILSKADFELGKITILSEAQTPFDFHIVNCGKADSAHAVRIVDPKSKKQLPDAMIGEIWAAGNSIAQGYWNQPTLTQKTFFNRLESEPESLYLRTSDLGFIYKGDLYITGRMNDLIVLQGKNYYPQDIELLVAQCHSALAMHGAAAFAVEKNGARQLVILQELKRDALRQINTEKLFTTIRSTLLNNGLSAHTIVLLRPFTLPKTSSGKIQRGAAKKAFLEERLNVFAHWSRNPMQESPSFEFSMENIKNWLLNWLYNHLQMVLIKEDLDKTIVELGINSIAAVELANDIQQILNKPIELLPLIEQCSINQLIAVLSYQQMNWHLSQDSRANEKAIITKPLPKFAEVIESYKNDNFLDHLKTVYFNINDGISADTTRVDGKVFINYSGYNYLGLSGNPSVNEAVIAAIKQFGTSVSASRLVSGEKTLHRELESEIASLIGAEASVVLPSGYATNITILTHLFGRNDLIIYDELAHNSIVNGALYSGAHTRTFPHNNYNFLVSFLEKYRSQYEKVVIITEGVFSMDGDIPNMHELLRIKKQFGTYLMLDEAHSMGVLGKTGRGIAEYFNLAADDVDIWMGTLSKAFASCGGYIAGSQELIENFKYTAAGFVYSAGISPANAAASLAAIKLMKQEPQRLTTLYERHTQLLSLLKKLNFSTGLSQFTPIIPIVVGKDEQALGLSQYLKEEGILALPIVYPAVPKNQARIRLFVNCLHTEEQILKTVAVLKDAAAVKKFKPLTEIATA